MKFHPDTVARITEYLALTHALGADRGDLPRPTAAEFARANQLAMWLQMELPTATWRSVLHGVVAPTLAGRMVAIQSVRDACGLPDDRVDTDFVWHWPGLGKPMMN